MHFQDAIIKDLAREFDLDHRIVKAISYYPIKFTRDLIRDPVDETPSRIRYCGVFTLKHNKSKVKKMNEIFEKMYDDIDNVFIAMVTTLGFELKNKDSARKVLEQARESDDYDKLKFIWDGYQEYTK